MFGHARLLRQVAGRIGLDPPSTTYSAGAGLTLTGTTFAASSLVLDRVTADTVVSNTGVETTIYTKSIAGGVLSTNVRLRLTLLGQWSNVVNDATTLTFRLKYGATTLATIVPVPGDGTNVAVTAGGMKIEGFLSGDGATNSQHGLIVSALDIGVKGNATKIFEISAARGTSAIDSTIANNLVVTAQWSAAVVGDTLTMEHAVLEQL